MPSLVHREKRWRRQNEQMFKGDLWIAQRLRNGVVFSFRTADGDVGGATVFSWSFDKTFKSWKLNHQTPQIMMLAAPFAGMRRTKVDVSWNGFAYDLFMKDVLPDHTADSAKDVILDNAASLDNTLAEDRYKQSLRKLEIVPSIRLYSG